MNPSTPRTPDAAGQPDERVGHHLRAHATSIVIPDTPIDVVMRRGVQRRNRRRTVVGVLSATALIGSGVVGLNLLTQDAGRRVVTAAPEPTQSTTEVAPTDSADPTVETVTTAAPPDDPVAAPAVPMVPSSLTWNVVQPDATEALGFSYLPFGNSGDGPLYAYSTAPGLSTGVYDQILYRSDDGITWTPANGVTVPDPSLVRPLASDGTRLYSMGTAAATAPIGSNRVGDLVVSTSDDQGATWNDTVLDYDLRALADLSGVRTVQVMGVQLATDGDVIVALASIEPAFDLSQFDGQNVELSADGAIVTPYPCDVVTGEMVDPAVTVTTIGSAQGSFDDVLSNCTTDPEPVSTSYAWADLGVDPAAVAAYLNPTHAFVSTDGTTFTEVSFPAAAPGGRLSVNLLRTIQGGFGLVSAQVALDGSSQRQRFFTSSDGTDWQEHEFPDELSLSYSSNLGSLDDGTMVLTGFGMGGEALVAASTDGGSTWTTTDLTGVLTPDDGPTAYLSSGDATIGSTGVTIVGYVNHDVFAEGESIAIERDGLTISLADQFGTVVFTDASTGTELGRLGRSVDGEMTPDRTVFDDQTADLTLLADDGSVRYVLSSADQSELYNQLYRAGSNLIVLHSDNGTQWSREEIDTLVGTEIDTIGVLRSGSSQITLTLVDTQHRNADGTPQGLVLVGTPNG